jgi:hypothetical protein
MTLECMSCVCSIRFSSSTALEFASAMTSCVACQRAPRSGALSTGIASRSRKEGAPAACRRRRGRSPLQNAGGADQMGFAAFATDLSCDRNH